jgi:hypothetical protein
VFASRTSDGDQFWEAFNVFDNDNFYSTGVVAVVRVRPAAKRVSQAAQLGGFGFRFDFYRLMCG